MNRNGCRVDHRTRRTMEQCSICHPLLRNARRDGSSRDGSSEEAVLTLGKSARDGGILRMEDCTLSTTRVGEDEVLLELHHASHSEAPISLLRLRLLSGGRLWPIWRENPAYRHADPDGLPKGAATVLQEEVGRRWRGWSLVSSTHEMSPEARRFRLAYLESHADMRWELDASLESDEGVDGATPRMDATQVRQMLEETGLHLPQK